MAEDFALNGVKASLPKDGSGGSISPSAGKAEGDAKASKGRSAQKMGDTLELSPEARKQIAELQRTDQEVRAHEAAHMAAGGGLVRGGASFSYQRGPDGRNYAVGGEVSIDASEVPGNPAATILKAQQIKAAALAPASPSPQDRKVAASAGAMAAKASAELAQKNQKRLGSTGSRLDVVA